jgi:hypothetical protein
LIIYLGIPHRCRPSRIRLWAINVSIYPSERIWSK